MSDNPPTDGPADGNLTPPPAAPGHGVPPLAPPYGAPQAPPAYGAPPAAGYAPPSYPPAYGAPGAPAPAHPGSYPPPGAAYRPAPGPYGYAAPAARTNPLAITALVSSIVGVVFGWTWVLSLGVIVGVITGHMALSQIRRTGEQGRGMALAGVIIGWVAMGLLVLIILAFAMFAAIGATSSTIGS